MGGFGSGGYHGSKQATIEEHLWTSIGFLAKLGFLKPGVTGTLRWNCGGEPRGAVSVAGGTDMVIFSYAYTPMGGEPESIQQPIHIERTPCYFGGSRPWFTCPDCHNRVGVLVCAGKLFKCRKCCDLPYASQTESRSDRASRRIRKIQKRLGNPDWENVLDLWFPKPKGMHWKTYDRIVARADEPLKTIQLEMASFNISDWVKLI
jgi:hypothetical protein